MGGPGDPPEGTPEGVPGGGDDEYRSVVFDESFVRAARLQEFSARERIGEHTPAVRPRRSWGRLTPSRQAVILVALIAVAFAAAVYMGIRNPYQQPARPVAEPLRSSVVPLAPRDPVPGGRPAELFLHSPAAGYATGAEGITQPAVRRTENFTEAEVLGALDVVREYVVQSSLDRGVLSGGSARPVRTLLDPTQYAQFDRSLTRPADDGRYAATGWLTRFDPARVELTDEPVRVRGTLSVVERPAGTLEVIADHTFVYAVRPAGDHEPDAASLFTVHRETRFRLDSQDVRDHRLELAHSALQAGPQSCAADAAGYLRPLFAGESARGDRSDGTDPYRTGRLSVPVCGVLDPAAQPDATPPGR
ncbi:hypothetical protein IHE55_08400 [Streptomyces pactum]|uniref:Uncharacterized protein n=1 Tax=Streptomyces pactum TaxID=68249 RepID=A0ABS0NHY2_9ACTN|nr:hypothetical protein [Streptomyces pactum]MBH5334813.1 hypothetical protein [Streptomyces pactum]